MSGWQAIARIARRSAWRHKRRSALVLLTIFVPAYAASLLIVAWSNLGISTGRAADWRLGTADIAVTSGDDAAVLAAAPPGTRSATVLTGDTIIRRDSVYRTAGYVSADTSDALIAGMYLLRAGRAPRPGRGEVAVTTAFGAHIGEIIDAGLPTRPLR